MDKKQKGVTLKELIISVAIIALIAAIAVPQLFGFIERARISADQVTVGNLNSYTSAFRINFHYFDDPFLDENKNNAQLINILIEGGYLNTFVEPQTKNATFEWCFNKSRWLLLIEDSLHIIYTPADHFTFHSQRKDEIINYDGKAGKDLFIPSQNDGAIVKAITGQGGLGAFQNKELERVLLPEMLTSIGNNAFRNNNLSNINLPDTIKTIGISAFSGNDITSVIIPDNVTSVGASAFHENPITRIEIGSDVNIGDSYSFGIHRPGGSKNFNDVYNSENGGAGTYIWDGKNWVKQVQ